MSDQKASNFYEEFTEGFKAFKSGKKAEGFEQIRRNARRCKNRLKKLTPKERKKYSKMQRETPELAEKYSQMIEIIKEYARILYYDSNFQNKYESTKYFKLAGELGDNNSAYKYACILYKTTYATGEKDSALLMLKQLSSSGFLKAKYKLAKIYFYENEYQQNREIGLQYFKELAESNYVDAIHKCMNFYL